MRRIVTLTLGTVTAIAATVLAHANAASACSCQ
jgi:hypothetical protein